MTLFFDTNVLIDHALMRETGQPLEITYIIFWAESHEIPILVTSGSFFTFAYVLQKNGIKKEQLKIKLKQYLSLVNIISTNKQTFLEGLDSAFSDLEDSFQYMSALNENCDYLITSNINDFKTSKKDKTRPITPSDFVLKILGKKKGTDF